MLEHEKRGVYYVWVAVQYFLPACAQISRGRKAFVICLGKCKNFIVSTSKVKLPVYITCNLTLEFFPQCRYSATLTFSNT